MLQNRAFTDSVVTTRVKEVVRPQQKKIKPKPVQLEQMEHVMVRGMVQDRRKWILAAIPGHLAMGSVQYPRRMSVLIGLKLALSFLRHTFGYQDLRRTPDFLL